MSDEVANNDVVEDTEVESPSIEDESTDLQEADSATLEEASADGAESNNDDGSSKQAQGSSRLQKIIDSKYGGDSDKFADALYEQWNSSAKLATELKELRSFIEEQKQAKDAPQPEPEPSIQEHEDYKALQTEIAALDTDIAANETNRKTIIKNYNGIKDQIQLIRGQLAVANDPALEAKQEALEAKLEQLNEKWDRTFKEDRTIEREKKLLAKQLKQVEISLAEDRAKQKTKWQESLQEQADFRSAFNSAIQDSATHRGIASDSKIRQHLQETITAQAIVYLQSGKGELPDDFVQKQTEAYFDVHGLAKKANFTELSKQKAPVVQQAPKAPSAAIGSTPNKVVPPKKMTADEARKWVEKKATELSRPRG